jgi:hypothetical protein
VQADEAGSSAVTAPVTNRLSETSGKKPFALSAQIGKSQLIAHSKPPPTAQPLIAPTTGLAPKTMATVARWIASTTSRASSFVLGVDVLVPVVAGAEGAPLAGEDDGAGRAVAVGVVEGRRHLVDQPAGSWR